MKPLFMEERRRLILDRLNEQGRVSVSELSNELDVSAVTIRQDLSTLEAENLLQRTHGGAVTIVLEPIGDEPELSYDLRRQKQVDEKTLLGKAAAALIEDGAAIAIDASTTVCSIIPYLSPLDSLTVVTNNLMATELLLTNPSIEVLLPAGKLRRDAFSIIGDPNSLPDINLNIGFVSAWGISAQAGLTEVNEDEMMMKTRLLSRCLKKVLLVDSTKWGQVAPYTYAYPDDIDIILTTDRVDRSQLSQINHPDIRIIPIK
ncbi:MAG: DeoR/GlpR family DNA-binding transcription regulator [Phototrophicaceae bacterium]